MDDYISREETVKAFCEKCRGYYDGHCVHRGECDVDVIQNAPSCVPQWISVKDRLPEGCETVLICNANKKFVASGYYSPVEKRWNQIGNRFLLFTITHWMPLPEPPKSEDDAE